MRLAIVSQPFDDVLPPRQNSIGVWTYEVARRLAGRCEVIVYARSRFRRREEVIGNVRYHLIPVVPDRLGYKALRFLDRFRPSTRAIFASRCFYPLYINAVARDLRRRDCDVVHVHNFSQFLPVLGRASPRSRFAILMNCEWLTQLDRDMIAARLERANLILGCSEFITDKIRARFPELSHRCRRLHNGADTARMVPPESRPTEAEKRIIFVGRISPEKGLHVLLEAFAIVIRKCVHARLEIVGPDGVAPREFLLALSDDARGAALARFAERHYFRVIRETVAKLGLSDKIRFAGPVPHGELRSRYADAAIAVQPSLWDAFPLSVIEAMACGLPVVGSRTGGIPEAVVDGETGVLVEPDNAEGLADALLVLLGNRELRERMGHAGRRRAVDLLSWDRIAEQALRYYQALS